jgi:hypothetical protein
MVEVAALPFRDNNVDCPDGFLIQCVRWLDERNTMIENGSQLALPVPRRRWYQHRLPIMVRELIVIIGLLSVLSLIGYELYINHIPASRKKIEAYFLVNIDDSDASKIDIYAIDDIGTVNYISRWIEQRIDHTKDKALSISLLDHWQSGLLGYDRNGSLVSIDCMYGHNNISLVDHKTLNELFGKYGHRVDTIPDRKPPKQSKLDEGQRIRVEPKDE